MWCEVRQGLGDRIVLAWNEPQPPSLMCGRRSAVAHLLVQKLVIGHRKHRMNGFGRANQLGIPAQGLVQRGSMRCTGQYSSHPKDHLSLLPLSEWLPTSAGSCGELSTSTL